MKYSQGYEKGLPSLFVSQKCLSRISLLASDGYKRPLSMAVPTLCSAKIMWVVDDVVDLYLKATVKRLQWNMGKAGSGWQHLEESLIPEVSSQVNGTLINTCFCALLCLAIIKLSMNCIPHTSLGFSMVRVFFLSHTGSFACLVCNWKIEGI